MKHSFTERNTYTKTCPEKGPNYSQFTTAGRRRRAASSTQAAGCLSAHAIGDALKRLRRRFADILNCQQANDNDQGQHHGIFNRRRTTFIDHEPEDCACQFPHEELVSKQLSVQR
jgi:hypothetical protein